MSQTSARRLMDVEDVVCWAAQELASRQGRAREAVSPLGLAGDRPFGLNVSRGDASLVGRWMWPAGFPEVSPMFANGCGMAKPGRRASPPDADAEIVEAAIRGLPARMAWAAPAELAPDVGFEVDRDGAWAHSLGNVVNLVLHHGRMGNRPALADEVPRPHPRLAANGKPGVWRLERVAMPTSALGFVETDLEAPVAAPKRKGDAYPDGAYGLLDWDPDWQTIVSDRADYLAWRLGLDALREALDGALQRIRAMAPRAALAPWLGDGDRISGLFGPGATRVHSLLEQMGMAAARDARTRRPLQGRAAKVMRPARVARRAAGNGR
jgi:hypothetical protein